MDYREKYKRLSEEKLVEIYFTKDKYDPEAIDDLNAEFKARGITEEYIDENYEHVILEKEQNAIDKILGIPNKIKSISSDLIDPNQRLSGFDIAKIIAIYSVLLSLYNAYYSYLEFQLATIFGNDDFAVWNVVIWLSFTIPLVAGILLWKEHKIGWIISVLYLVNKLVINLTFWFLKFYFDDPFLTVFRLVFTDILITILLALMVALLYHKKVLQDIKISKELIISITLPIILYSAKQAYSLFNYATESMIN